MDELWLNTVEALKMLCFDRASLCVRGRQTWQWQSEEEDHVDGAEQSAAVNQDYDASDGLMKLEIPLTNNDDQDFLGKLVLIKDLKRGAVQPYTMRRVESLRRTLIPNIKRLKSM